MDKQGNLIKKFKKTNKKKLEMAVGTSYGIPSVVHLTFGLAAQGILPNYFEMFTTGK